MTPKEEKPLEASKWLLTRPVSLTSEEKMLQAESKRQRKRESGARGFRREEEGHQQSNQVLAGGYPGLRRLLRRPVLEERQLIDAAGRVGRGGAAKPRQHRAI
eukprot:CAMPEP_0113552478 /NCGR_PEP_ID=MMETSP0015_2-20120614/15089_1 /TAXON_ID=2838 /ORGANISM="Odontella" /LENGTH=102 /DNA_ID=CAMNT_0000453459 /DNA_START=1221 /DNA_END=1527 /DNA_ORIENTATION=- /assembly_acc=CAM_ASM_000160